MNIRPYRFAAVQSVEEFVNWHLDADTDIHMGGNLAAFGRLLDLLAEKGVLSASDIHRIARGFADGEEEFI